MEKTDLELVREFQNGNKNVFEILIKRYQKQVYNTTYRILGSPEDAEDCAQEAFIRVYKYLSGFKKNSSFSTWLFKITTNLCRDALRKRKKDSNLNSLEEKEYLINEIMSSKDTPEDISINREIYKKIQIEINKLPSKQKITLVLREFQNLSYQEIAEILDISIGTVKSRLSRARRNIRENINHIIKRGEIA